MKVTIKGIKRNLILTIEDTWIKLPILKHKMSIDNDCRLNFTIWLDELDAQGKGFTIEDGWLKHSLKEFPALKLNNYSIENVIRLNFIIPSAIITLGNFEDKIGIELVIKKISKGC